MLRVILLLFSYSLIFASYSPVPLSEETNVFKDEGLVQLAYSRPIYNNIGKLYSYYTNQITGIPLGCRCGSATYIGGKICLTSAHCEARLSGFSLEPVTVHYEVVFEIDSQEQKLYKVKKFICHPQYEQNHKYDLAILILEKPVEGLTGLKLSDEFSKSEKYEDEEHLLTYVGYGVRVFDNPYFLMLDDKRRAIRAHTQNCSLKPTELGIYATPYKQHNRATTSRALIPYEAASREGMSGGAVINANHELVSIIFGTMFPDRPNWSQILYNAMANVISIIPLFISICGYPIPYFASFPVTPSPGTRTKSIPLAPFKAWIEEIRRQYDDTHHMDRV